MEEKIIYIVSVLLAFAIGAFVNWIISLRWRNRLYEAAEKKLQYKDYLLRSRTEEMDAERKKLKTAEKELAKRESAFDKEERDLYKRISEHIRKESNLSAAVNEAALLKLHDGTSHSKLLQIPLFRDFKNDPSNPRVISALSESVSFVSPISAECQMRSSTGKTYTVSLTSCTCDDFRHRHPPACKHMYRLAIELGLLASVSDPSIKGQITKALNRRNNSSKSSSPRPQDR